MTNEQNARIASALAGYEVQVSPAGKHYIVTDEGTRALVDFENSWDEAMTTFLAIAKSRQLPWRITPGWVEIGNSRVFYYQKMPTLSAVAHCLLQIAEGEE